MPEKNIFRSSPMQEGNLWSRRKFVRWMGFSSLLGGTAATIRPWFPPVERLRQRFHWGAALTETKTAKPRFAYVGYSGSAKENASCLRHGIAVFANNGSRWVRRRAIASESPTFLALHPSQPFLYAINEVDNYRGLPSGSIEAFAIDCENGELTLLNRQSLSLSATGPKHLAISPDGRSMVVAVYKGGAYNVLPIGQDGHLERVTGIVKETGSGPISEFQSTSHPRSVLFDNTGRHLLAADPGSDRLSVFSLANGKLIRESRNDVAAGSGPAHLALHPSANLFFVLNELDASLSCFRYDPARGMILEVLHRVSLQPGDLSGRGVAIALAVHPSGRFLYVCNRPRRSYDPAACSIAVWSIDSTKGTLTPVQLWAEGLHRPRALSISPDGSSVLVLNEESGLHSLPVDAANGRLGSPELLAECPAASSFAIQYA
jgi:6-phosphogluconolactonase